MKEKIRPFSFVVLSILLFKDHMQSCFMVVLILLDIFTIDKKRRRKREGER